MSRVWSGGTIGYLLAAATLVALAPVPTASVPSFLPASPPSEDEGGVHSFGLNVVSGRRDGLALQDVRVSGGFRPGELVNCHLQNEASIVAYGDRVYVAYNDTRKCNDDLGLPGVRRSENGFARSTDGGRTFEDLGPIVSGSGPVEHLSGDPTLAVDTRGEDAGTVYYSSLAGGFVGGTAELIWEGVGVGVSRDGGGEFEWYPASGPDASRDKPWIAVDNSGGPYDGNVYVTWAHTGDPRSIRIVRSEDAGRTWSAPISLDPGDWTNGARPIVGPDGAVHVVWLRHAGFTELHAARSTDGGRTFSAPETVARFPDITDSGACPGYTSVNGKIRVYEMPSVAVDSHGSPDPASPDYNPDRGRLYVTWPAKGVQSGDATDVWLTSRDPSTGAWSTRLRVNDDQTDSDQLFPEVVVPGPGHVLVSWTDRRDDPANLMLRQYAAESGDGGASFGPSGPVSDLAFPPPYTFPNSDPFIAPCYAGDYNGLYAGEDGTVYAAWGDQRDDLVIQGPAGQRTIPDPNVYFRSFTGA